MGSEFTQNNLGQDQVQTLSPIAYEEVRRIRKQYSALANNCYADYLTFNESNVSSNIKIYWSHVNSLRKSSNDNESMRYGNIVTGDPAQQCTCFLPSFPQSSRTVNP